MTEKELIRLTKESKLVRMDEITKIMTNPDTISDFLSIN